MTECYRNIKQSRFIKFLKDNFKNYIISVSNESNRFLSNSQTSHLDAQTDWLVWYTCQATVLKATKFDKANPLFEMSKMNFLHFHCTDILVTTACICKKEISHDLKQCAAGD